MPRLLTTYFGEIDFADASVFQFPHGLPGFETEHAFVFLRQPHTEPLMFMQSLTDPKLCFILLPILVADPRYRVNFDKEDIAELKLEPGRQPRIGEDILCAAILRAGDAEHPDPTVNLMAPVVVNLKEKIGMQVIQPESGYSHREPLFPRLETLPCS
ncbi:MAG TPA: flagellar assembly protein FliW [Bryobacteraceae bacterium]|nr:flagellar assembly protein FliW [Bryobacteraceae bacterium]